MAVTLISTDGLFTRLGKIYGMIQTIGTHQGTLVTEIDDILDEYNNSRDMAAALADRELPIQKDSANSFTNELRSVATKTMIDMVHADNPLPSEDLNTALIEIIRQMDASSDSVDGGENIGVTHSADAGNTGDGDVYRFDVNNEGLTIQTLRAEDIKLECITDTQISGTSGRETFDVKGEVKIDDIRDPNWPGGSGIGSTLRVTDPAEDAGSAPGRNILTNSGFENFTVANTPDNWTVTVGVVGTDIFEEGTIVNRGSKALAFKGDGSTLVAITQTLNTSGQTTGKLKPKTRYVLSRRVSADSSVVAGTFRISVKDGSDTILDSGNAAITTTASGISTGGTFDWTAANFVTPLALPDTTKVVIEFTVAVTTGKKIYIDDLCLFEASQFGGPNGPSVNLIANANDFVKEDKITVTVSNDYDGLITFYSDMLLDLHNKGLQFPFNIAGGETVPDSLVS